MKINFSNHIGYFLQEVARKSAISLNDELKILDITYAQFRVINCLSKKGPLSQKEILKIICVTPATLTGTVDILEKKQLVYREAELEDARTKKIYLTSAGEALQKEALSIVENFEKKTTDFLTSEERELILKSLKEMEKRL
ncbi:MAG: MarR family winged helix-turn-helix transcriptional regulator [Solirubrobacterales bacterium]